MNSEINNIKKNIQNQKEHLFFIKELSKDLSPVDVHWTAEKRSFLWLLFHISCISLFMFVLQPFGSSLFTDLQNLQFLTEVILLSSMLVASIYLTSLALVPGAIKKSHIIFTSILLCILVSSLIYGAFTPQHISERSGRGFCEFEIFFFSLAPLIHLGYLAKKGGFHNRKWAGLAAGCASSLIPVLLMHFACAYQHQHILLFHMTPIVLISAMSFIAFLRLPSFSINRRVIKKETSKE